MLKVRVGFILGQVGWTGGVNYYRNLFSALKLLPNSAIQPIIFAGLKSDVSDFDGLALVIRSRQFDRKTLSWLIGKFLGKVFPRRDYLLYSLLRKNKILRETLNVFF